MAICKSFEELRQHGFALQASYSLKHKHVRFLVNLWVGAKLTGGAIENKLIYLWAFSDRIRYPDLVGTLADHVDGEEHDLVGSHVARPDKSWEANGIDAELEISEVAATDRNVAVQLKLQAAAGLRVKEIFLLRPAETLRDGGLREVTHGRRGGRSRLVPVGRASTSLRKRQHCPNPSTGTAIPPGYANQQWREYVLLRAKEAWPDSIWKRGDESRAAVSVSSANVRRTGWRARAD